ncbi:TPA_asm: type VI secretion system tip protein VgrG, partial [Salmonella enterica subsp. salamae]|nr:type VI secretion system tip protein VgrG [Salmonella enterica subsp. salamae]
GALGIKVEGDIVLESSSRISLKAGGSFIVIHAGGVDIMGPKINLNGGGSAGTPVSTLQPAVLEALAEDGEDNGDGGDDGAGGDDDQDDSGGGDDEQDDPEKYYLRFHFIDDDSVPYANTRYVAHFADGTQREGVTDDEGYTEVFIKDNEEEIRIHLFL